MGQVMQWGLVDKLQRQVQQCPPQHTVGLAKKMSRFQNAITFVALAGANNGIAYRERTYSYRNLDE